MSNLTHLFKVGQAVLLCDNSFDALDRFIPCTVKETHTDYIIITDDKTHTDFYIESGFSLDMVYPAYNFGFDCVEDAIDHIQKNYKSGNITLDERNRFLKSL